MRRLRLSLVLNIAIAVWCAPAYAQTNTSTTTVSMWQKNLVGLMCSVWAGVKVARSGSVAKISGIGWGSANSP